ncbi:hypothetical protein SAMN05444285_13438 [Draconibacterium orientale]|uniref:Transposase n=1 Tax=Draconibacterium orientale TaxID=1168034 RepID=A0A1I0IUH1_9BACT|nr:hypothetical protein SAMN05444285_13438 [Draconibacterium orientale]
MKQEISEWFPVLFFCTLDNLKSELVYYELRDHFKRYSG